MVRRIFCVMLLTCFSTLSAENYQVVNDGPLHEAFAVKEAGSLILEPTAHAPPPKITEMIPKQNDPHAIWIPGYWCWSCRHGVFLWTSGVWRRPPPGMQWVGGYWKNYPQGWVWISGYWTDNPDKRPQYLSEPPPEPIDQRVPTPPAAAENYFWVPGTWQFDSASKHYIWYAGRWDILNTDWVYCPAHYVWREEGYIFVPGFWDWPMKVRGEAFATIYVEPAALDSFVYRQAGALDSLFVMEQLFPFWPDYACLFHYHYFFHYDVWSAWGASPPWWNWPTWTALSRTDDWALWWWWTHPGYPNPSWLTPELAQSMTPPQQFVIEMMSKVVPPLFVTRSGVVSERALFNALSEKTGNNLPIFPVELKQIENIQKQVAPPKSKVKPLEPKGGEREPRNAPEKPFFGPSPQDLKAPPSRVILPPRPIEESQEEMKPLPKKIPSQQRVAPTQYYMQPTPRPQPHHYQNPWQGYQIEYEYPQVPMQSKHQNRIMGHPQPQINPSGPNAHPVPGNYSTLPGQ